MDAHFFSTVEQLLRDESLLQDAAAGLEAQAWRYQVPGELRKAAGWEGPEASGLHPKTADPPTKDMAGKASGQQASAPQPGTGRRTARRAILHVQQEAADGGTARASAKLTSSGSTGSHAYRQPDEHMLGGNCGWVGLQLQTKPASP